MKFKYLLLALASVLCAQTVGASTLLVYNNNNNGAGSLRQAIVDNAVLGGGNTIIFSNVVSGTITLTTGELLITKNVTILGPGANVLAVNGNFPNTTNRVFHLTNAVTVAISGLTITNGFLTDFLFPASYGGGIFNDHSTLTLSACVLSGNSASGGGGGIYNYGFAGSATLTVSSCTLSGNSAGLYAGGIYNAGATLTVIASTLSGNSAQYGGGIINNSGGGATLISSTLSGNSASSGVGGGIYNADATLTIGDTILKTGASGANIVNYSGTVTSLGYNLTSDNGVVNFDGGTGSLTALGDRTVTEPMLGPLQDNGGPTPTMMPLPGSPAIDQGKNLSGLATDQRGRCRTYDDPGILNAIGGDGTDIGAVEVSPAHGIVGTTNDNGASLRWCICDAQPGEVVTFARAVTNTITLTSGELLITKNVTIVGPDAKVLTVNGNHASRVFHIGAGATVAISGLTITNGNAVIGGGIYNDHGTLTVSACVLTGNSATSNSGGGISNDGSGGSAALTVSACVLSGNSAGLFGGGIYNGGVSGSATLTVSSCTLSGNSAGFNGGGIDNDGDSGSAALTVIASTLSSNSAGTGGGILNNGNNGGSATLVIGDTVLKAGASGPNIYNSLGTVTSLGYNLSSDNGVVNVNGGTGSLTALGDRTVTEPMLGPLQDNGGPTPTMALLPGSPAIDKGKSFGLLTDQRGAPRPFDFSSISNASGGDGSDIGAFEVGSPKLNIQKAGSSAVLSWPSYYGNFSLQSSTNVTSSNNWIGAGGSAAVVGQQYQQTNSPISGSKFFRLRGN